jgi:putative acyl-CoA dehydrogenase
MRLPAEDQEPDARRIASGWARVAQACAMLEQATPAAAEAFLASRFDPDWGPVMGIAAGGGDARRLVEGMWEG